MKELVAMTKFAYADGYLHKKTLLLRVLDMVNEGYRSNVPERDTGLAICRTFFPIPLSHLHLSSSILHPSSSSIYL
jgi:hypothetical protein